MTDSLERLRARIDALDQEILDRLVARAEAAQRIGELKQTLKTGVMDPGRERAVLEALLAANHGRYPPRALTAIFREIISASRAMEEAITVGFLGRPGAFADLATRTRFGASVQPVSYTDPGELLRDLEAGAIRHALVSRDVGDEDPALDNFDRFLDRKVTLFGETRLDRGYAALALQPDTAPSRIFGHPAALARCRGYLEKSGGTAVATAGSFEACAAALAGEGIALAPWGSADPALQVAASRVEDDPDTPRRFLLLATSPPPRTGRDRTAFVCTLANQAGALSSLLAAFQGAGINVAWIEMRESRHRPWEHAFFLEVDGHQEDSQLSTALAQARMVCSHLQTLGSYPLDGG